MPAITIGSHSAKKYIYDIFISYRRVPEDQHWVFQTLVPALRGAGLSVCLDEDCFRLGEPLVTEMERAVLESRYTLAVFSPDYMSSGFTTLENVMVQHLGMETRSTRFIGLILRECQPDLRFRAALMLDMTDSDTFKADIERIVSLFKYS